MGTAEIIKLSRFGSRSRAVFRPSHRGFKEGKLSEAPSGEANTGKKKKNKLKLLSTAGLVVCVWYFIGTLISHFSVKSAGLTIEFEMFSDRISLFGFSVARQRCFPTL